MHGSGYVSGSFYHIASSRSYILSFLKDKKSKRDHKTEDFSYFLKKIKSQKTWGKNFVVILRPPRKIAGSGVGSGSVCEWFGSPDPVPYQNITDPQHGFLEYRYVPYLFLPTLPVDSVKCNITPGYGCTQHSTLL
jgi:hypothetical protein